MFFKEVIHIHDNCEMRLTGASGEPKLLWNQNLLGRFLYWLGVDLRLGFVTGSYGFVRRTHNLITNVGHAAANARISGQGAYSTFVNLALGTSTTAAAAADTTLGAEITTNGGGRGAATATQVTTTVTNDTTQLVKTWTFSGALAITEEGILDNAVSGGSLLAHQVFLVINVGNLDSLTFTHKYSS